MKRKIGIAGVLLSVLLAFVFFTVNVNTTNVGGITGTVVVRTGTPQERIDQTRNVLRFAGIIWVCIGVLSLAWVIRSSRE